MNKLPLIEMEALNALTSIDSFQNEIMVSDLDGTLFCQESTNMDNSAPVRINAMMIIIVMQGNSRFFLDYVPYTAQSKQMITIFPSHTIQTSDISADFRAKMVTISKTFMDGWFEKRSPSMLNYFKLVKNPCTTLEQKESVLLTNIINSLRSKIRNKDHFLQKEAIQIGVMEFFVEVGNILMKKKEGLINHTLSRKEELLNQFLELLFAHCKKEHQVSFYADNLCISPQYLSLILNEFTGKSASKWIDEALMTEAKILLKSPNITIQQVANTLNFSDQSSFGKFFKKHTKMSPLEYRKT